MDAGAAVMVRGIYATALTNRLKDEVSIVTVSPTIDARFETVFPTREPDVSIESTGDRQGIVLTGDQDVVEEISAVLQAVARDGFVWNDPIGTGAIVDAAVTEILSGGGVLDLGGVEGYLAFDAVDGYLEEGDCVRVQVDDPAAPWANHRHEVKTDIEVQGAIVSLVRGVDAMVAGTPRGGGGLVRTTELLDVEVPDRWGVRWEKPAIDREFNELADALAGVASRARTIDEALTSAPPPLERDSVPVTVAAPHATAWVRFGRECRFALDACRREIVPTLDGHHRVKAGGDDAGVAVEFVERLGATGEEFPVEAVLATFGPCADDTISIQHGKPDGREYDLGPATVTNLDAAAGSIEVERQMQSDGTYDALAVEKAAGDIAETTFKEGRWWYPTTYRSEGGDLRGTYLNVNTPLELFPATVRYVDLHVDVVKWPDGRVEVVDRDELNAAVDAGQITAALADRALAVAGSVADAIEAT